MNTFAKNILGFIGSLLLVSAAFAQPYSIDWFTIGGGGGTSTGGGYSMSGTIGNPAAGNLSGGGYTLEGGFWSADGGAAPVETIFDNTSGSANGYEGATTNTWLAEKLCVRTQAYSLDSVTLLLVSGDNNGEPRPRSPRLQIYSNDPVTGKPSTNTGVIMNLSGATNPMTLAISYIETPVKWVPATPFVLAANQCYWTVLSTESEMFAGQVDSFTMPTGQVASFGRGRSIDAGATWEAVDNFSSRKMLIRGTPLAMSPPLPQLRIFKTATNAIVIAWPAPSTGFKLQENTNLAPTDWVNVTDTVSVVDSENQVILPPVGNRFYRLFKP